MDSKISKLIGEIAEHVAENDLAEITYEEGDFKVKVVGKQNQQQNTTEDTVVVSDEQTNVSSSDTKYIRSPMVGVVYLKPSPDDKTFVSIDDRVDTNTTVCMIEAMKTFNPIKAGMCGIIKKILVENGDPVEYDQPIMEIIFDK